MSGGGPDVAPPRLAGALLDAAEGEVGAVRGDLDEEYRRFVLPSRGRVRAHAWYWRQTLVTLPWLLRRRWRYGRRRGPAGGWVGDLVRGARSVGRRPAPFVAIAATFALGLGASAAVFAVVHAVVLRPLPYADADRLVRIHPDEAFYIQLHGVRTFREHATAFDALLPWARTLFTFTEGGSAEEVRGALVSWDHFQSLGVQPELGRAFRREDAEGWPYEAIILGHGLWVRRFGADPGVVGARVEVRGRPRTVVGVLGADHVPGEPDWEAWAPLPLDPEPMRGNGMAMNARLRPAVSLVEAGRDARAALAAVWGEGGDGAAGDAVRDVRVVPLRDHLLGEVERPLRILLAAAVGVLLLACSNVSLLLLAQGERRRGEIATRLALGASSGRVTRELLLQTTLAAVGGGALGLAGARAVVSWGVGRLPPGLPRAAGIELGLPAASWAAVALVVCVAVAGVVPARRAVAGGLRTALAGAAPRGGGRRPLLGTGLVGVELAVAVVLLAGAGLMLRSFLALRSVDPGFDPEGLVAVRVVPPGDRYDAEGALDALYRQLRREVGALPGVQSTGAIMFLPMSPGGATGRYRATASADPRAPSVNFRFVTPGYFRTLGIPLLAGRGIDEADGPGSEPVALVNERLAGRIFPGEDPVGRTLYEGVEDTGSVRIVGVVGDVRQTGLRDASIPEVYLPHAQHPFSRMYLAARTTGDPARTLAAVQRRIHGVDDGIVLARPTLGTELVGRSMADTRIVAQLLSVFAGVALLLGAVGVYGVTAHGVARTTREIGIRMALGADGRAVVGSVVRRAMVPVVVGLAVGTGVAGLGAGALRRMVFDVSARDPLTLVLAPAVLGVVAFLAVAWPAYRAGRVDPVRTLGHE